MGLWLVWLETAHIRRAASAGGPRADHLGDFTHEELAGLTGDTDTRPLIVHEQVKSVLDGLYDRITADGHYMRATRRWNEDAPDPLEFVPGDVLVLRLLATSGGNSAYLIGRNPGSLASNNAGRISLTNTGPASQQPSEPAG